MDAQKLKHIYFDKIKPLLILSLAITYALSILKYPDPDTNFIISTGKYIVENNTVPITNPFVIHQDFKMIVQQWLFDVLIYGIYNTMGQFGTFLYSLIIMCITGIVMYKFFGFYTEHRKTKITFLSLYIAIFYYYFAARPTSISFLMCLLVIMIMEHYSRNQNKKLLLWLPLISLFTVNVHASIWPMLFVLMMPFVCPDIFKLASKEQNTKEYLSNWFKNQKAILLILLVMFFVGFINPNGIRGMSYVFLSYGEATKNDIIMELKKPAVMSIHGFLIIVTILCFITYLNKNKENQNCALSYMAMGTIILAMMHIRNIWFLCFSLFPLVLTLSPNIFSKIKEEETKSASMYILSIIASLSIIIVCILGPIFLPIQIEDQTTTPIAAVEYIKEKPKDKVILYTDFNNGAYMELHGFKVYLDARPELFQKKINGKEDIYTEYVDLTKGKIDYKTFLEKYNFTHMLIEKNKPLEAYMRNENSYKLVVEQKDYCLYEIKGFNE